MVAHDRRKKLNQSELGKTMFELYTEAINHTSIIKKLL